MNLRKIATIAIVAALSIGAGKPAPRVNWNTTVAATPTGAYVLGNPDADIKLVEFVSYTCSHCAEFEKRADSAMRIGYVAPGKLSVEVRTFLRNPVDLAIALLTHCGPPSKFFLNHTAFLRSQDSWIGVMNTASPAQRQRWQTGEVKTRLRYIATDFRLYEIIATRGYDRRAADTCLADEAKARQLSEQTAAADSLGVSGTPSFMLNGDLLVGTHDWQSLDAQIKARL